MVGECVRRERPEREPVDRRFELRPALCERRRELPRHREVGALRGRVQPDRDHRRIAAVAEQRSWIVGSDPQ